MIVVKEALDRLRVYTQSSDPDDTTPRKYISSVKKQDFEIPAELKEILTPTDFNELQEIIEIHRHAGALQQEAVALNLPATLRMAVDYARTSASVSEIKLISQAIDDARRELRRNERNLAQPIAESDGAAET